VIALGTNEPGYFEGSRAFADELRTRGGRSELVVLEGMAHDATALALGDEKTPLFAAILRMIKNR
jgi:hypothetical protein